MTIDGTPGTEPTTGGVFTLDEKAHVLGFTCRDDVCEPKTISIVPGDKDESISIELRILPAKLVVEGDPSHSYGIEEMGHITLGSGVATEIAMKGGAETITVYDRSNPAKKQKVKLRAGKETTISFKGN